MDLRIHGGYLFFVVTTWSSATAGDIKLYKLSLSDLSVQTGYPKTYSASTDEKAVGIVCYATYVFVGGLQFNDSADFLALRFNDDTSSTGPYWSQAADVGTGTEEICVGIDLDYADIASSFHPNFFVGGYTTDGDIPEYDYAFAKFDYGDGDVLGTKRLTDENYDDRAVGIRTSTANGSVIISGTRTNLSTDDSNFYVTQFSHSQSSFTLLESLSYGASDRNEFAGASTLDSDNAPWILGVASDGTYGLADQYLTLKLEDDLTFEEGFTYDDSGQVSFANPASIWTKGSVTYAFGFYSNGSRTAYVGKFVKD